MQALAYIRVRRCQVSFTLNSLKEIGLPPPAADCAMFSRRLCAYKQIFLAPHDLTQITVASRACVLYNRNNDKRSDAP
jgi:hypothetical protein